jgi:putative membrane protein
MGILLNLALSTIAVMVAAYLIPGVEIESIWIGLILTLVIALINTFIKPILKLLTLPISFLTLGLFSLVLNGLMIMLADSLVDGFAVAGLLNAILFALMLGLINGVLGGLKS